ncbi:hypothetical protein NGRA_2186 [Nosema granulosis]|uniref:Uncharacterized protein n=1 Tax=Nosema granulosis TaxID=83296 RepID=A0A9P6GX34_9MICR|nr:hypothetical protein NGRA_2186 [Nosema granulosis]
MIFLILFNIVLCEEINVMYGEDPNLILSVVRGVSGGQRVRLISKNSNTNLDIIEIFSTTSLAFPTKLLTPSDGYICGKPKDPGVVTCIDQRRKSEFKFEKNGIFVNIKADNGECLTKAGRDSITGGFYLNLKKCSNSSEQKFTIKKVETYKQSRKPAVYTFDSYTAHKMPSLNNSYVTETHNECKCNCPLCKENTQFLFIVNEIESLAKRLKNYISREILSE